MAHTYPNQQEALLAKVKGKTGKISDKTHEEHLKLYTGYVNKSNGILAEIEKLGVPDPANPAVANQIYSTVRALKVDFTFAIGGLKNHELYFSILGGDGKPASRIAARGWAWTGFDHGTKKLFNYIGDAQNTYPVWGVTPILGLDVYEHAYYADFYTNRGAYIDEFLNFVDWKAVEALLPKA